MPQVSNDWMLPYKAFYSYVFKEKNVFGPRKPLFYYLKEYRYKVYMLKKSKNNA